MLKRRWRKTVRKVLTCAICSISLVALLYVHVFPSSKVLKFTDRFRLPMYTGSNTEQSWMQELVPPKMPKAPLHSPKVFCWFEQSWMQELVPPKMPKAPLHSPKVFCWFEQSWMQELVPPKMPKAPLHSPKLDGLSRRTDYDKLWKSPSNRDFVHCVEPSPNYTAPGDSEGYLVVHSNGGLNQMRAGICDMVAVAQIINATLVIPELDKHSFWNDSSNFSDIFDEDYFINALADDVKVIRKLPEQLANATRAVKHFKSWSGMDYYREDIASMWKDYQIIRAAKSDSRLANNNLPLDIQKLRCRACYLALRFAPRIEEMGKLLVERMRSYGPYIGLHLRYEKDMLAFTGCTHDLSPDEAEELRTIRASTLQWKGEDIDPEERRSKGLCPLTPKEVGMFLTALGYPSNTPIYIAAGEIYGGDNRMEDLLSRYPILMRKEKLASIEELEPFANHASQLAALDYIVSVESDVFIPSYSGNMARAVEGHRRFLGHKKTISPDRKFLVRQFDKIELGRIKEGSSFSNRVIEAHKQRIGSPRKRKGPISGTKGTDRFRSEEAFYVNPLPDCLCRSIPPSMNLSLSIR